MFLGLASVPPVLATVVAVATVIPVVADKVGSCPLSPVPDSSIRPSPESLLVY